MESLALDMTRRCFMVGQLIEIRVGVVKFVTR